MGILSSRETEVSPTKENNRVSAVESNDESYGKKSDFCKIIYKTGIMRERIGKL